MKETEAALLSALIIVTIGMFVLAFKGEKYKERAERAESELEISEVGFGK